MHRKTSPIPLSVVLSPELRRRVAREAEKRALKLSSTVRALVQERMSELEEQVALTQAEEWQRAEVWATWERFKAGDRREVPWERVIERADRALKRRRRTPPAR